MLLLLAAPLVEHFVLSLNASYLPLDFLGPLILLVLQALVGLRFEFANLVDFGLFFNFKKGLLNGFGEEYIKDRLDLCVIVKEVIVFNLSDLIDAGLLRDVRRSRWAMLEFICLNLSIIVLGLVHSLLG